MVRELFTNLEKMREQLKYLVHLQQSSIATSDLATSVDMSNSGLPIGTKDDFDSFNNALEDECKMSTLVINFST